MRTAPRWISLVLAAGVVMIGLGIDNAGWSGAAVAQKRSQGRESVDRIVSSLRAVDTAYASGNAAEAQTRFTEARAAWNSVAPRISAREAREQQLLFDSLDKQLKSGAPATKVKSTVSGMIGELHEDIERELR
jgi:thioesterase domain-containing protein